MSSVAREVAGTPGEVGGRIRSIRRARRLSLRELGKGSGTSASFLSQLERGTSGANLGTLMRICDALGVGISDLFASDDRTVSGRVTRASDHPSIHIEQGYRKVLLSSEPANGMQAFLGVFAAEAGTGELPYTHGDSQEWIWILEGTVLVTLGEATFELHKGDTMEYRTSMPHGLRNYGTGEANVLWIVTPPTV